AGVRELLEHPVGLRPAAHRIDTPERALYSGGAMTPDPSLPAAPFHRMAALRPAWAGRLRPPLTLLAAFIAYVVLISVVLVLTILVLALAPGVNVALGVTSGDPTAHWTSRSPSRWARCGCPPGSSGCASEAGARSAPPGRSRLGGAARC